MKSNLVIANLSDDQIAKLKHFLYTIGVGASDISIQLITWTDQSYLKENVLNPNMPNYK